MLTPSACLFGRYRKLKDSREVKTKSNFGTLRVTPFPFTAVFRYDDCDDYVVLARSPVVKGVRRIPHDGMTQVRAEWPCA